MGAEIGNSTQKLHARGPIGLRELCTFKYLVDGTGQVRALSAAGAVGILGGTFNPPHLGHLVCAQEALRPARARPRAARARARAAAQGDRGRPGRRAPAARCASAAVAGDERLGVSRVDVDRPGPSFTVDTLRRLHADAPEHELTFIVGGDMAYALPTWREPEAVLELAELGVAEREGVRRADIVERLAALRGGAGARALLRHAADRRLVLAAAPAGRGRAPDPLPRARRGGRVHRGARPLPRGAGAAA